MLDKILATLFDSLKRVFVLVGLDPAWRCHTRANHTTTTMKKAFGTILKRKEGTASTKPAVIKPPPQDAAYVAKFSEAPEIKNEEILVCV
jgi:hypothetical protein